MPCTAFYFIKAFEKIVDPNTSIFMKFITDTDERLVEQKVVAIDEETEVAESEESGASNHSQEKRDSI